MEYKRAKHLVAWIDGGCRGNPGPSGCGAHIQDQQGKVVKQLYEFLGVHTNNYAEYMGLLLALRFARQSPENALHVLSDSALVVNQVGNGWNQSNEELRPLYKEAQGHIWQLKWFRLEWIPREQNRLADRLANIAMDMGAAANRPVFVRRID